MRFFRIVDGPEPGTHLLIGDQQVGMVIAHPNTQVQIAHRREVILNVQPLRSARRGVRKAEGVLKREPHSGFADARLFGSGGIRHRKSENFLHGNTRRLQARLDRMAVRNVGNADQYSLPGMVPVLFDVSGVSRRLGINSDRKKSRK